METKETITVTITTKEFITTGGDEIKHAEIQEHYTDILGTRTIPLDTNRFIDWLNSYKD